MGNLDLRGAKRRLEEQGFAFLEAPGDDVDHVELTKQFGALHPQYDGELIWSIKADERFDDHYHSLNTKKLSPHTECYEYPTLPPSYLALWCIQPAACGGGKTTLYDSRAFLEMLAPPELELLRTRKFTFCSSSGIQASKIERTATNPFLETRGNGREVLRFSRNCVDLEGDALAESIADRLVEAFERDCVAFEWTPGAFLIWDNHRMLHSRTAYEDRSRELRRAWVR